jgi:hypothetical protein
MKHLSLYVFSKNGEMLNSLCRFIKYTCVSSNDIRHNFDINENAHLFHTIDDISNILDRLPPSELLHTAVLLDITDKDAESTWNVISEKSLITDIAGRLALMYPEVYWIFIGFAAHKPDEDIYWSKEHFFCLPDELESIRTFLQYHSAGYTPLFNASGLRSWLKHFVTNKINNVNKDYSLPSAASAIDEESAYTFMNGYIAYRMGYRCYPVTTMSMMKILFKSPPESQQAIEPQFDLIFEDIFISFPDKVDDIHLSKLKVRDENYKKLKNINKRIFVTVGHKHIQWYESNIAYIECLKGQGKKVKMIYKPSGGIYNLLHESGLFKKYWKHRSDKWSIPKKYSSEGDGHSAPGKLLEIAESLINRAKRIYHEAKLLEECIYGAVLASEAIDLLDYRTPTTCLEAIALRHELEVKAECMFYGVEYNIDIKNRLRELKSEIGTVSRYFHKSVKEKSSLNAQMMIVTEIMKIFRDHGQFDEEQECMKYFRKLNRQWYFKKHSYLIFFKPLRYYFDTLIGNFRYFLIAILLLPLILGIMSHTLKADFKEKNAGNTTAQSVPDGSHQNDWDISNHIVHAYFTFYGLMPVKFPINVSAKVIIMILVIAGFFHLGIFVSFLFTILSRRN